MTRKRYIRKKRGMPWTSETSRRANDARWAKDRAKRDAEEPERIREIWETQSENLPRKEGDTLGILQWTDARTGKVRRWKIEIGNRADRIAVVASNGDRSGSHGWTWFLAKLRQHLCRS